VSGSWKDFSALVSEAYDLFWQKNKLAVDEHGRTYRTNIRRVRPKPAHELDFRNKKKAVKIITGEKECG
jgi:hypothetical protein